MQTIDLHLTNAAESEESLRVHVDEADVDVDHDVDALEERIELGENVYAHLPDGGNAPEDLVLTVSGLFDG